VLDENPPDDILVDLEAECVRDLLGNLAAAVATKNPERAEKASVLRLTALVSPTCLSLRVPSSQFLRADSEVGRLWN